MPSTTLSLLDLGQELYNQNVGQEFCILGYRMPFKIVQKTKELIKIKCTITEAVFYVEIPQILIF